MPELYYESFEEAAKDGFRQGGDIKVIQQIHSEAIIKEVKFLNLPTVMSKIGGFSASILAIFSLFYFISWNMFIETLAKEIAQTE